MINIYFDFDGCMNPFSGRPPKQNTQWTGKWSASKLDGIALLWSHELIEKINEIAARGNVRPIWLTDWQLQARDEIAPLIGLKGPWEVLTGDLDEKPWWKLTALENFILENPADKHLWIDDNAGWHKEVLNWLKERPHVQTLVPLSMHGVTKKQMNGIIEFIDS